MAKGIIYVMSTVVDGLIKIGKTGTDNYNQRMNFLESNGYRNVSGLKRQFAIEVDDYDDKEALLDNLFSRSRVSNTELFSLNINEVIQLLSSFEGKVIFPMQDNKTEIFETATEAIESLAIPNGKYTIDLKPRSSEKRVTATMIVSGGKMTVLKGAVLGRVTNITQNSLRELRNNLKEKDGVLSDDFIATSPSMAATIVTGRNSNGWKTWKNQNGKYIDIYRQVSVSDESD